MSDESAGDKVVYLARAESGRARAVPHRIERLRTRVESRLVAVLRAGLERAHEALAQVAAQEGEAADACRRGMQAVRLHRHDMEQALGAGVEFRFAALTDPSAAHPPLAPGGEGAEARLLAALRGAVGDDTPEAVRRALGAALPSRRVSPGQNPLAPAQVTDLFLRVTRCSPLAPAARRVVLEVLTGELERALPGLCREALELLAAAPGAEEPAGEGGAGPSPASERHHAARAVYGHERVERGRERVEHELERCLEGREPPALVERLLRGAWARRLLLVYVAEGPDSEAWVRSCALMERLLWSFEPRAEDADRQRLVMEIPLLLHELADGLREVLGDPFEVGKLLEALEGEYLRCLTRDDPDLAQASANDDAAEAGGREANVRRLGRLPEGTWMEIQGGDERWLRVRLAGYDAEGRLVFANRAGFKVLERDPEELAEAIAAGRAHILDDHHLFNEGLSRVVRRLSERRLGHAD